MKLQVSRIWLLHVCHTHALYMCGTGLIVSICGMCRSDVPMPSDRRVSRIHASSADGDSYSYQPSSSSNDGDGSDSDGGDCTLDDSTMTREQLVGVTALACDGPRLLTGNADGRVLYQDFREAKACDMDEQRPPDAARQDQHTPGVSRFWYRPR